MYSRRGVSVKPKISNIMLRLAITSLFVTSILGNTTLSYSSATSDDSNSEAVNVTLTPTSPGNITANYSSATADGRNSNAVNVTLDTTSSGPLRDICLNQGKFYCQIGATCIYSSWHCDGVNDCLYNEDELGCMTSTSTARTTTLSLRDSCLIQGKYYCQSGRTCIYSSWRCDGVNDCLYNEDELGCTTTTSTARTTVTSSSCGGTLYGSGYVRSPNYPSNYYNYLNCNWTLIASPDNGYITLQFYAFNTESCCDFLSIYHGNGTLISRYSGTYLPSNMYLGSTAFISFTTDSYGASSGFSMYFYTSAALATTLSPRDSCERQGNFYCALSNQCVPMSYRCSGSIGCTYGEDEVGCSTLAPSPTTPLSSCGGTLYGSGYVRSPNYPQNYDNYLRCNWTLIASPYNGYITLQFYAFSTESCCDYLSIYHSNGTLISRYSGTTTPSPIVLGSYAVLSFNTDSSAVSSGFSIWFSTSVTAPTTPSPRDSCEQQGYFYCALSNLCIASWRRCDGYTYCYYGEDEAGCSGSSTTRTPLTTPSQRNSCLAQGNFYCEFSRDCIAMWRRCDGYPNCYYGEDESGCANTTAASRPVSSGPSASEQPQGSFIAASGFAQVFLQLSKSSASEVHRGSWIFISGYIAALQLGLLRSRAQ